MKALDQAIAEWAAGHYYEAHELLEDVAEEFEADEPGYAIALALVQVAASFHKLSADVAPRAVPGKLDRALPVLEAAPAQWHGLELGRLVIATKGLRAKLDGVAEGKPPPRLEFPILERS